MASGQSKGRKGERPQAANRTNLQTDQAQGKAQANRRLCRIEVFINRDMSTSPVRNSTRENAGPVCCLVSHTAADQSWPRVSRQVRGPQRKNGLTIGWARPGRRADFPRRGTRRERRRAEGRVTWRIRGMDSEGEMYRPVPVRQVKRVQGPGSELWNRDEEGGEPLTTAFYRRPVWSVERPASASVPGPSANRRP